jgi:hypothetical protein
MMFLMGTSKVKIIGVPTQWLLGLEHTPGPAKRAQHNNNASDNDGK